MSLAPPSTRACPQPRDERSHPTPTKTSPQLPAFLPPLSAACQQSIRSSMDESDKKQEDVHRPTPCPARTESDFLPCFELHPAGRHEGPEGHPGNGALQGGEADSPKPLPQQHRGESPPGRHAATQPGGGFRSANGRSRLKYQRGSLAHPAARNVRNTGHSAAQCRQSSSALALNQRLQRFSNKGGLFHQPGKLLRSLHQMVIKSERCSHARIVASNDDALRAFPFCPAYQNPPAAAPSPPPSLQNQHTADPPRTSCPPPAPPTAYSPPGSPAPHPPRSAAARSAPSAAETHSATPPENALAHPPASPPPRHRSTSPPISPEARSGPQCPPIASGSAFTRFAGNRIRKGSGTRQTITTAISRNAFW